MPTPFNSTGTFGAPRAGGGASFGSAPGGFTTPQEMRSIWDSGSNPFGGGGTSATPKPTQFKATAPGGYGVDAQGHAKGAPISASAMGQYQSDLAQQNTWKAQQQASGMGYFGRPLTGQGMFNADGTMGADLQMNPKTGAMPSSPLGSPAMSFGNGWNPQQSFPNASSPALAGGAGPIPAGGGVGGALPPPAGSSPAPQSLQSPAMPSQPSGPSSAPPAAGSAPGGQPLGPTGGYGGMMEVGTSITPGTLFSPEQTQRAINQDASAAFTQADARSLLPGQKRQGFATGAGTRSMIAPQQGALEGSVMGSMARRPIEDALANENFKLQGEAARGKEGLALADLLRQGQASQTWKKNALMSPLLSALLGSL